MDRIRIFDTTLRDGEQSPGFSMTPAQKLRMARLLAELNVDIIEAGFPSASAGDFASVQEIARQVRGPIICALARCNSNDIQRAAEALAPAGAARLHVFIATSPIHRKYKLRMSTAEVLKRVSEGVALARELCADVEFSAEDALRSEPEFLMQVVAAALDAGASTINIPDTVGYAAPEEVGQLFANLQSQVPALQQAVLSAHCHDDLGLALSNSLAAIKAGARQVECTINGIGERAGNCSLEELVMALRTRRAYFKCDTGINTRALVPASRLLSGITGQFVPRNKAIVGENAFAHESGIHQHGVLAHRETYEIMRPEDVGVARSQLVLGKHSGRHAVADRAKALGHTLDNERLDTVFQAFKQLADRKRQVFDADLEALITGTQAQPEPWRLLTLRVDAGVGFDHAPSASVTMQHANGTICREAAVGDGPLDATFKAIGRATGSDPEVLGLVLRSVTEGRDAQAEARVRATWNAQELDGLGISTDVVAAGTQAFIQIINQIARQLDAHPAPPAQANA